MLGGAAVSIALPPLDIFLNTNGTAYAAGGALPARFGLFFWGNGNLPHFWVPEGEGSGDDWQLSDQLQVLAPHKDKLCVVSGMNCKTENIIPHNSGAAGILTGASLVIRDGRDDETFAAPSIDQVIANGIGRDTRFKSLEFGAEDSGRSYNGPDSRNPAENDPYALFERVFGAGFRAPGDDGVVDPAIGLRRSVLDAVLADASALNARLGVNDQQRLESHLDGIRDLELRLARLEEDPPNLEACVQPEPPTANYEPIDGRPQLQAKNRIMCDIAAMCLACDQTRVISNWITGGVSNILIGDATAGHHQLTHDEPGDQPQVNAITKAILGEYAYMLEALRSIPEGDGTLLDNCAVMASSEVSLGRTHSMEDMPLLIGGSACGRIKNDFHYRSFSGDNASTVLLTLVRAMGIVAPSFGIDEGMATDSLGSIEV